MEYNYYLRQTYRSDGSVWVCIHEAATAEKLGYTEFDDEFVRQIIQKITVEDADTIRIQFRDSDVVLEQGLQ